MFHAAYYPRNVGMDLGTLQRRGRVVGEKAALPSSMSLLFFASVSRGLFCAAAVPCEKERTERKKGRGGWCLKYANSRGAKPLRR